MPEDASRRPVALVSGGASELGTAIGAALDAGGHRTVLGWRSTAPDTPGPAVRFDTTDEDEVAAAIDATEADHGPLEVVVANAGFAHLDLAVRMPAERFRAVVDTDLTGAWLLARAALARFLPRRSGRIVLVGSVAGLVGVPGVSGYAAAKAGLVGMARTLAREAGSRGITVNVVAPGLLDSGIDRIVAHRPTSAVDDRWMARTPAGRPGTAAEVASAVAFVASPAAAHVTGAVITVDGGFSLGAS